MLRRGPPGPSGEAVTATQDNQLQAPESHWLWRKSRLVSQQGQGTVSETRQLAPHIMRLKHALVQQQSSARPLLRGISPSQGLSLFCCRRGLGCRRQTLILQLIQKPLLVRGLHSIGLLVLGSHLFPSC